MELNIIDYSSLWFCDINKEPLPAKRNGKFILLINETSRWAVFSPKALSPYHANIAERFCSQQNIPGTYNAAKSKYYISDPTWNINGGGRWDIDDEQNLLTIYGSSDAYGSLDLHGLSRMIEETGKYENVWVR